MVTSAAGNGGPRSAGFLEGARGGSRGSSSRFRHPLPELSCSVSLAYVCQSRSDLHRANRVAHILQERGTGFITAARSKPRHGLDGCRMDDEPPGSGPPWDHRNAPGERRRDDSVQRVKRTRVLEVGQQRTTAQRFTSPDLRRDVLNSWAKRIQGLALIAQCGQRPLVLRLGVLAEPALCVAMSPQAGL